MPVKSTFAVEIGEGFDKFKEFEKLFRKYRSVLGETPSAYAAVTEETVQQEKALKGMTASILSQLEVMRKEERLTQTINTNAKETEIHWRGIATHARNFWTHLTSVATSVRNNAVIGGLLGLGGLWGLDRLGERAGNARRASSGLGVSYGDMNAFGLSYNRAVDANGLLSAVSQARGNIGGAESSALMALGISPLSGDSNADLAQRTLKRVRDLAKSTREELLGPVIHEGYGANSLGFSIEDLRRLKNMDDNEFGQYNNQFGLRRRQLGTDDNTLKKWQDFVNTLDTTGKRIETSLVKGLVNAAPALEKLSDAAATFVEKFVGSSGFEYIVERITTGLTKFANYVGTEDFKKNVDTFIEAFNKLAHWAMDFVRWVNDNTGLFSNNSNPLGSAANNLGAGWIANHGGKQIGQWFKNVWGGITGPKVHRLPDGTIISDDPMAGSVGGSANASGTTANVGNMADMLKLVARLEGGTDGQANSIGAVGKYQIMPQTAIGLGFTPQDMFDPKKNEQAATKLLEELSARYKGNTAQILAAYNAGPQIGDYLRDHGKLPYYRPSDGGNWDRNQTQGYLDRAGFKVTIENPAGSSVTTQSNMLGGTYPGVVP